MLLAETTVNGIACKTAFAILAEEVKPLTPKWQEPITGVSGGELPKYEPALIHEPETDKYPLVFIKGHGTVKLPLQVSNAYPPGVAFTFYAYPAKYYPESDAPQALHVQQDTIKHPIKEIWGQKFRARMEGSGQPGPLLFNPGEFVTDTLYDVLVDVRKA